MTASIRVQLLGPVRASNTSGPISLRGKTARTVPARLALSAGSVVGADQMAEALGPVERALLVDAYHQAMLRSGRS